MILGGFLEKVQLVLHRGDDQVVLSLLVVLRLLLGSVSGALGGLRAFMDFIIFVLDAANFLFFYELTAFEIP